jgi:hypothetical protein
MLADGQQKDGEVEQRRALRIGIVVGSSGSGERANLMKESGTVGSYWTRIAAGVPSCEICTLSYASRENKPENEELVLGPVSAPRYDIDDAVDVAPTDAAPLGAAGGHSALRSTPSTIWAPERWIAPTRRNSCSMFDRALGVNDPVGEAVLGIEGCSPDCGRPGVEGSGVEGIWEQARVFWFL